MKKSIFTLVYLNLLNFTVEENRFALHWIYGQCCAFIPESHQLLLNVLYFDDR